MLDIDIAIDSAVDALCILCNYAPEGVSCQILCKRTIGLVTFYRIQNSSFNIHYWDIFAFM
jgi:hypothetical protein